MALNHSWMFTKTSIDWNTIEKATRNKYKIVSARGYSDKKGILPDGYTLTLKVLYDDFDYGVDKKTGIPRENNTDQNFEVTVLTRKHQLKKGDYIRLLGFDADNSYYIDFGLLLRFRDCEILTPPSKPNV